MANGSILPRESGVSQNPMKGAIAFEAPESMEVPSLNDSCLLKSQIVLLQILSCLLPKTQVVRTLEDMNFFCIDNLPPALIPKFAELCRQTQARNTALVVDVRGCLLYTSSCV